MSSSPPIPRKRKLFDEFIDLDQLEKTTFSPQEHYFVVQEKIIFCRFCGMKNEEFAENGFSCKGRFTTFEQNLDSETK